MYVCYNKLINGIVRNKSNIKVVGIVLSGNITIQQIVQENSKFSNGVMAPLGIKNNQIEYIDYSQVNNLLVCGTTGSGKTTFVRTLIASLIATNQPESVQLCLFDSKRTDYTEFSSIPHLIMPILHDGKRCQGMLSWVLSEAERRYTLLSENISELNCPDIFVVIDDYAQIVQEPNIQKTLYDILQIAPRVKIHIIIVTAITLAKIISTEIKVNIPYRISFFLPERRNSQVVLDENGAEVLEAPGQFIAKFYSKSAIYNSIELSNDDINKACQIIEKKNNSTMDTNNLNNGISISSNDELYRAAVMAILDAGEVSTTIIQKKLMIGYPRASKLLDEMTSNGVITPFIGSKPREILITKEQFLKIT